MAILIAALIGLVMACAPRAPAPLPAPTPEVSRVEPTPKSRPFTATAYSVHGHTASGGTTHRGIVAADPKVLPLGTRIRVSGAGSHSGVYTVTDTGRAIHGHDIDLYIPDERAAQAFGRRQVQVEVLGPEEAKTDE